MRNAGIGQHALDIGLRDGDHVAEDHRRRRDHPEDAGHIRGDGGEGGGKHTQQGGKAGDLRARGHESRHRRGRALIDIRRPHVEGNRRDLEAKSDQDERRADGQEQAPRGSRAAGTDKSHDPAQVTWCPVAPKTSAVP